MNYQVVLTLHPPRLGGPEGSLPDVHSVNVDEILRKAAAVDGIITLRLTVLSSFYITEAR